MRQRTTFLHNATAKFDPKELVVARDSLTVKSLDAAREDRLTFALPELPQEVNGNSVSNAPVSVLICIVEDRLDSDSASTYPLGFITTLQDNRSSCVQDHPGTPRILYTAYGEEVV